MNNSLERIDIRQEDQRGKSWGLLPKTVPSYRFKSPSDSLCRSWWIGSFKAGHATPIASLQQRLKLVADPT